MSLVADINGKYLSVLVIMFVYLKHKITQYVYDIMKSGSVFRENFLRGLERFFVISM